MTTPKKTGKPRGFQTMSKEYRTAIARKGGMSAHRKGGAHKWTSEEAAEAGRRGGYATQALKRKQEREQ